MAGSVNNSANGGTLSFPGKIAVITNLPSQTQNDEEFWSGEQLVVKYGTDKVIHVTWPSFFVQEREQIHSIVASLAVDREIRALVMNQAIPGCNAAVDKLKRIRDDIFFVYCTSHESPLEVIERANLVFATDDVGEGPLLVKQAKKQGARTFVHYSFPRHMSMVLWSSRRDSIREVCAAEGLQFVDALAVDPQDDSYGAQQFISNDIPRLTAKYGEDTAFFCTNCFIQVPLIRAVVDNHAIFPQPCCPSPYHGFPEALGIETAEDEVPPLGYVINESRRIAAEKKMTGRLSTWPVSVSMMSTHAGFEYAVKWIKNQVPETGIDDKVLMNCMTAYIREVSGEDSKVFMSSYSEKGSVYDNYKLLLMDYLDY